MTVPRLALARHQTHRCLHGHLWVWKSELAEVPADLPNGAEVAIVDERNRLVGRGFYSAASQIAVRLWSRHDAPLDAAFLRQRLERAIAARAPRPARRLVSSEADLTPGLIVDQYGDRLVVQATTVGVDARLDTLVQILDDLLHPTQVVERNDLAVRTLEGLTQRSGVLRGPADTTVTVPIGRFTTTLDLLDPHKTGTYLDQQANHEGVAAWVRPGDRVADVFCHLGGFALHALAAGAASAVAVDQSAASTAGAEAAARTAGLSGLTTATADAFDWLRAQVAAKARFDLIVLDPPSFTRNRAGVPAALKGYRELHVQALKLLAPGGRLLTYSCSHHISAADYRQVVVEAAGDTRRTLRQDGVFGASPDHPVLPAIPETEYLKGFGFTVLE